MQLFVKVTLVVCPVGLRIVNPGYVPPYVHIFVHGPSRICTHASSIPIETFASVLTGGKSKGCEKGGGVGVGVAVEPEDGPEIFVVIGNFDAMPATLAAIRARNKSLILMPVNARARASVWIRVRTFLNNSEETGIAAGQNGYAASLTLENFLGCRERAKGGKS